MGAGEERLVSCLRWKEVWEGGGAGEEEAAARDWKDVRACNNNRQNYFILFYIFN